MPMKFCYECGYKLDGSEKICPECGEEFKNPNEAEELLESIFNQVIEDIGELKEETLNFLEDFDIEDTLEDFSKNSKKALNRDADYINRARKKIEEPGEERRVIGLCNKAIAINELNWEAYFLKGIALYNLRRYDESIEELINSLALNEENLESRVYIARAYFYKNDADYAIKVYDSILNIDEKYYNALEGKAIVYFTKRNYKKANEFFKKANDISPLSDELQEKWDFSKDKLDGE